LPEVREGVEKEKASLQAEEVACALTGVETCSFHPTSPIFPEVILLGEPLFLLLRQ
jgi:hypothetical protein